MRFTAPKLFDCTEHGSDSELFIVEGDSAARSIKRIRDRTRQAILPMQGKPMNANKADRGDLQNNAQFAALIKALGVDLSQGCDALKIRYERVILLFDPDADGIHGRTLMLLFFHRWLRPLLDAGRIFDTHAPQWEITGDGMDAPAYADTPEHLHDVRSGLEARGITRIQAQRFRGLGSVSAEILQNQCVDAATRELTVLSSAHAENAIALFEQMRMPGGNSDAD